MRGWFTMIGATAGGWIGWSFGAGVGIGTAYALSAIGTFAGIYAGWWVWQRYLR